MKKTPKIRAHFHEIPSMQTKLRLGDYFLSGFSNRWVKVGWETAGRTVGSLITGIAIRKDSNDYL